MSKGLSATQRTLRELRAQGRIVEIVEKWITIRKRPIDADADAGDSDSRKYSVHGFRKDLFGFIDLIALDPSQGIVAIQSCGQSFAAHLRKLLDSECTEFVIEWLKCGGKVELWGWRKVKLHRGGKALRWQPRITRILWDGQKLYEDEPVRFAVTL